MSLRVRNGTGLRTGLKQVCTRCGCGAMSAEDRPRPRIDPDGLVKENYYHTRCFELTLLDRRAALAQDILNRLHRYKKKFDVKAVNKVCEKSGKGTADSRGFRVPSSRPASGSRKSPSGTMITESHPDTERRRRARPPAPRAK